MILIKKLNNNDQLVLNILNLIKKHKVNIDNNFSIFVNNGPGSFSSIRISLAVAKGIKISKKKLIYLDLKSQILVNLTLLILNF